MKELLSEEKYNFISDAEKAFIVAFDAAMEDAGYATSGIQPYVCLGKYKIEYSKADLKTKRFVARIYFRDSGIALRLYFTDIDRHSAITESATPFIKDPFINEVGRCKHCDQQGGGIGKKGRCSFKKSYTLDQILHEKCAGENYYFSEYSLESIPQYMALLGTFYPPKRSRA